MDSSYNDTILTEEYNGTSWSSGGDLSIARILFVGRGNSSDAIVLGGIDTGDYSQTKGTEEYNGTAWSSGAEIAAARLRPAGGGNSSNAICMVAT
jgi:hypothetical protein